MFKLYTKLDAPPEANHLIEQSIKTYSFLPNLHAVLAEAPIAYEAYLTTFSLFENKSHFTPLEQQIVFQTANYENECNYCMPGHSMLMTMMKMPQGVIEALREGTPIQDRKLETLRHFTRELITSRGHVSKISYEDFREVGYTNQHALEILVGLASKLISNFTNSMANTPVDETVKPYAWTHPSKREGITNEKSI